MGEHRCVCRGGSTARHLPRGDQECPGWVRAPQVSHCAGLGPPYMDIVIPPYADVTNIQINPDTVVQRELLQPPCLCSERQSGRECLYPWGNRVNVHCTPSK